MASVPRYGTRPSMPSGTSLASRFCSPSSVGIAVDGSKPSPVWKYRSLDPAAMADSEPMPRYDLNDRPWYRMVSPGLSSVPANSAPTITTLAPAASALVMSPEYLMPPSAMMGMPASRVAR